MRSLGAWIRLAIVLSALWLIGIGLYAAYAWHNAYSVDSPFVYYVIPNPAGGWWFSSRIPQFGPGPTARFNWDYFLTIVGGVLVGIWVLTVGTVWVIAGFTRNQALGEAERGRWSERRPVDDHFSTGPPQA
jgi:hypothetical protein